MNDEDRQVLKDLYDIFSSPQLKHFFAYCRSRGCEECILNGKLEGARCYCTLFDCNEYEVRNAEEDLRQRLEKLEKPKRKKRPPTTLKELCIRRKESL